MTKEVSVGRRTLPLNTKNEGLACGRRLGGFTNRLRFRCDQTNGIWFDGQATSYFWGGAEGGGSSGGDTRRESSGLRLQHRGRVTTAIINLVSTTIHPRRGGKYLELVKDNAYSSNDGAGMAWTAWVFILQIAGEGELLNPRVSPPSHQICP